MEFTDFTSTDFQLDMQRLIETDSLNSITPREFAENYGTKDEKPLTCTEFLAKDKKRKKRSCSIMESYDYDTSFMF
jgi:hypothetical protein